MQTVPNHHFIAHFPSHSQDFLPFSRQTLFSLPFFNISFSSHYQDNPNFSWSSHFQVFHPLSHSQDFVFLQRTRFYVVPPNPNYTTPIGGLPFSRWSIHHPSIFMLTTLKTCPSSFSFYSHVNHTPALPLTQNTHSHSQNLILNHLTPILKICGSDSHRQNNFTPSPTPPLKPPPP